MFAVRPVMLLVNEPVTEPSVVLVVKEIVGFVVVLQHTPLAVTVAPPLLVIFPPLVAVVWVIEVVDEVLSVGTTGASGLVVKLT